MTRLWIGLLLGVLYSSYLLAQGYAEISAAELLSWQKSGKSMMLLDVRGRDAYAKATLAGAINGGLDPKGFLPGSNQDPVVLIIAKSAGNDFTRSWVDRLKNAHLDVYVFSAGIKEWVEQGGEVFAAETFYSKPGTVPFRIPKGLCEEGEPAQRFE